MTQRKPLFDVEAQQEQDQQLECLETPLAPLNRSVRKVLGNRSHFNKGRPTDYDPAMDEIVESLLMLGTQVQHICAILGISQYSYYNWAQKYKTFAQAILTGRELADARVAKSLYHRAVGYTHPEEKITVTKDGEVIRTPTLKHYPPDTSAGIYWLNNRSRGKWKSTVDAAHQSPDGQHVDPSQPPQIRINATPARNKE